jgi:hypothetical protein
MAIIDTLRRLFGGGGAAGPAAAAEPVEYRGYQITPAPQRQGSGWNTAGVIAKAFEGGLKEQPFVRVDTHARKDDAIAFSITKAQQIIDEQGDRLFQSR